MAEMTVCGLICGDCPLFGSTCQGCAATNGRPFWTAEFGVAVCPIYNCSMNEKGYSSCGQCRELPCETFTSLKDPNMSEEDFQKVLKERISRLRTVQ